MPPLSSPPTRTARTAYMATNSLDAPSAYSFDYAASTSIPWPNSSTGVTKSLVVTMELPVRPGLSDYAVLELMKRA
jgi:hypothetical protein